MALQLKQLKMMALTTTEGDVYYVPNGKTAIVKGIRLVNDGDATATVNLWIRRGGGTSYRIIGKNTSLAAGAALIDDSELTMEGFATPETNSDRIRGQATGSTVHIVLSGVERDV